MPFADVPFADVLSGKVLPATLVSDAATMPTSAGGSGGINTSVAKRFNTNSVFATNSIVN